MVLPDLRHFGNGLIYSDPVEALVGEAWVLAIYTDKGWATSDGASLSADITEWRHAVEAGNPQKQAVTIALSKAGKSRIGRIRLNGDHRLTVDD